MRPSHPRRFSAAIALSAALTLWPGGVLAQDLQVRVLSGRPDMVSGGSALVEISGLREGETPTVTLGGRTITDSFRPALRGALRGRVEGLPLGSNMLEVRAGSRSARLNLVNHPVTGPVFSGPHQTPFICETEDAGLGSPRDPSCSVNTVVQYFYRSTDPPPAPTPRGAAPGARGAAPPDGGPQRGAGPAPGGPPTGYKRFDPAAPRPADLARTTTTTGRTVDFIVRRERGTINRAIYEIAFLHAPSDPLPDPWTATPGWNGRLVYTFGGGCAAGYRQGGPSSAMNEALLSAGYAVAASSLNVFGTNCDHVISAETMMMVKEHFIERYGVPAYTIGNGGSGGSMQQHLIAQNYPGLLDGLTPTVSYPDAMAVVFSSADCSVIARAMEGATETWTEEQQRAVGGFATWRVCGQTWARTNLHRAQSCNSSIPEQLRYHPVTNPTGARCSNYDNQVNVYGRDSRTGFTRRPLDNVGIQYGLLPFNAGVITAAQFVELNEKAGGHDSDGNPSPHRSVADPEALRRAYEYGIVNTGGGSLGSIPIIDSRDYRDPAADIHDSYRSFVTRARIAAANGGRADNHVILRTAGRGAAPDGPPPAPPRTLFNAVRLIDTWLTGITADTSSDPAPVKIARHKPAELVDACWTSEGDKLAEPAIYGRGRCNDLYPTWGDPRMAAGAPLTDNVLKCTLKPFDPRDYKQPLTADQIARLRAVFPAGVCDWSKAGVSEQVVRETWRRF